MGQRRSRESSKVVAAGGSGGLDQGRGNGLGEQWMNFGGRLSPPWCSTLGLGKRDAQSQPGCDGPAFPGDGG